MTAQHAVTAHPILDSPWIAIARDDAHEWFKRYSGAPWPEFYRWAAEDWEPREFWAAGHGTTPHQPHDQRTRDALTAAHLGLAAAVETEATRRQRRTHRGAA